MCNDTDLAGKNVINNIKRHDCDCEMDDFGIKIGKHIQHEYAVYEVVRISNGLVECRKVEGLEEQTIILPFAEVKHQLLNYYTNND